MREFVCVLFGAIFGGIATAIGAGILWSWREEKRGLDERLQKLEKSGADKDVKIQDLERELMRLGEGGDDF